MSFFICPLGFRVALGNHRAGLALAKPQCVKQPLALPNRQMDVIRLLQMVTEQLPVPQSLGIAQLAGIAPEVAVNRFPHDLCDRRWPAGVRSFTQPFEATILETPDPALNGVGASAQQPSDFVTVSARAHQQQAVQAMVVFRFIAPNDLLPHQRLNDFRIVNDQLAHRRSPFCTNQYIRKESESMRIYL